LALCLVALLPSCGSKAGAENRTILIVNGDDVGIVAEFTDAAIRAFDSGAIDSMSVVASGHDAERAVSILKSRPEIPVGLHYTLVGDWKPLSPGASLHGPDGDMWATSEEAAAHALAAEAVAEFDAQLKILTEGGIDVKYVDSHVSGYFTRNDIFLAIFERARALRIPLISSYYPGMPEEWRALLPVASYQGIYSLPDGMAENRENRAAAYWELLSSLGPGIHYIFSHQGLGFPDADPTGDRLIRVDDSIFWTDPSTRARIAKLGMKRGSVASVRELFLRALATSGTRP
jgi:hypothetical protein